MPLAVANFPSSFALGFSKVPKPVPLKVQNGIPIVPPVVEPPPPMLEVAPPPVELLDLNEVTVGSAATALAAAAISGDLGITLVRQVKDNWCWFN